MAVFPIRQFGDPVLRRVCPDVPAVDDDVRKLIDDMLETMVAAPGVGLAAPQIGVVRRVIVWDDEGSQGALVNARIQDGRGSVTDDEACLSVPGLRYPVVRAEWVRVQGLDRAGGRVTMEAEGFFARILQHEIDHTDGVLFIDRLDPDLRKQARGRLREIMLEPGAEAPAPAGPPAV